MKRMLFAMVTLGLLLCPLTVSALWELPRQGPFLIQGYDPQVEHIATIDYDSDELPCFPLLLRVVDSKGSPVKGLGCSFFQTSTTDENGECHLKWSGETRTLHLFNRYVDSRSQDYRDAYLIAAPDPGVSAPQTLTLVWNHETPLEALEHRANRFEVLITDHLGQPVDGLTPTLTADSEGATPIEMLFSGQSGRYVYCDLRTSKYQISVVDSGGEVQQKKSLYRKGETLVVEMQLKDPNRPRAKQPFSIVEIDPRNPPELPRYRPNKDEYESTDITLRVLNQQRDPVPNLMVSCTLLSEYDPRTDQKGEIVFRCPYEFPWMLNLENHYSGDNVAYRVELSEGFEQPVLELIWGNETPKETIESCPDRVELTVTDADGNLRPSTLWFDTPGILEMYRNPGPGCPVGPFPPAEPGRFVWLNPAQGRHAAYLMAYDGEKTHYLTIPFTYSGGVLTLSQRIPPQPSGPLQALLLLFGFSV